MFSRKVKHVISISFLLGIVLFKFQNCAPAPDAGEASSGKGENRIIEDWYDEKVVFADSTLVIANNQQLLAASGLCPSSSGSNLHWHLVESDRDLVLEDGVVTCQHGAFQIQSALPDLDCGASYVLVAEESSGGRGLLNVQRDCAL